MKDKEDGLTLCCELPAPPIVSAHILELKNHHTVTLCDVHHIGRATERGLPFTLLHSRLVLQITLDLQMLKTITNSHFSLLPTRANQCI